MTDWEATDALDPPICFGLKLHPLQIGHLFLLRELGSPLFHPDAEVTPEQILLAVAACKEPHDKARRHISAWGFPWFIRGWGWVMRNADYANEVRIFRGYIESARGVPEFKVAGKSRPTDATPDEWLLVAAIMHKFSRSWEEALSFPVYVAQHLLLALASSDCRVEILDADTEALFDMADKL